MFTDEEIQTLNRLGLSISQAKVYLTLAQVEDATIKTIAQITKIARQDIYRIMNDLQEIGLVEKIVAAPNKFRAIPFVEGITILAQRKQRENGEIQTKVLQLLQRQKEHATKIRTQEETNQFVLVPTKETHIRSFLKTMENAETSADTLQTCENLATLKDYVDKPFKKLLRIDGKIRFLVCIAKDKEEISQADKRCKTFKNQGSFQVRYTARQLFFSFLVIDKKECLIASTAEIHPEDATYLYTNSPIITGIILQYFEQEWKKAHILF
jgi:sugar-specific transcriptional regulator TrmB